MNRKLIIVGALLAVGLIALALYFFRTPKPISIKDGVAHWVIDPVTFEVKGPESAKEQLAAQNTPEKIEERRKATLMVTNPKEYFRQFPKNPERLKAEADAAFVLANPKSIEQTLAEQTPEKRAEMEKARQAIFQIEGPKDRAKKPPFPGLPAGQP